MPSCLAFVAVFEMKDSEFTLCKTLSSCHVVRQSCSKPEPLRLNLVHNPPSASAAVLCGLKGKNGRHRMFSLTPSMFQWRVLAGMQLTVNNAYLACVRPWCEPPNHVYTMLTEPRRQCWVPRSWNCRWLCSAIRGCWELTPCPLLEQQVLLATKMSLAHQTPPPLYLILELR